MCALSPTIASVPRGQCTRVAMRLLCVPLGVRSAASFPSIFAAISCNWLTLGSSPNTSSPSSADAMASRMSAEGSVTVSLLRSITFIIKKKPPRRGSSMAVGSGPSARPLPQRLVSLASADRRKHLCLLLRRQALEYLLASPRHLRPAQAHHPPLDLPPNP